MTNGDGRSRGRRSCLLPLLLVILGFSVPSPLSAQSEMAQWFGPTLGKAKTLFSAQETGTFTRSVQGQKADWRTFEHGIRFSTPLRQDEGSEWSVATRLRATEIQTEARFPQTGQKVPETLWDLQFGSQYRRRLENGWIGGVAVDVGSASDQPFHSLDETGLRATVFARMPEGERNGWLFLVNYDRHREFLENIPLPGVGYWYEPHKRLLAIIGIPFAFVSYRPVDQVSLDLAYLPIRTIHAGVSWRVLDKLTLRGAFDWEKESSLRADRADRDARLFRYEKKLTAGCRWRFGERVTLDLSGGYAFDRMVFEGKQYSDRDFNRIEIADGPFLSGRAGVVF